VPGQVPVGPAPRRLTLARAWQTLPGLVLPFPHPPLADAVVALRPWREDDVPARLMAFADPLVQRFSWPRSEPYTEADARDYYAGLERARREEREVGFALVSPGDDTDVLGGASLHAVELPERRAAVGYWLAPPARGRGVATHATRLLAGWSFEHLGLERLELTCGPDNGASQHVAERCGFTREGLLRSHMRFKAGRRDTLVYGLLPGELG
jgi:RimJ/RimL family protein N-acetyltransferase